MNWQNNVVLFDVKQNFNATKLLLLCFSVFSFKYWIVIHRCRQLTLDSLSSFPLQTYCWVEFHCFEFLRMKDMLFLLLKYLLLFLGITIPIHLGCQLYIDIQVTNHPMHSYNSYSYHDIEIFDMLLNLNPFRRVYNEESASTFIDNIHIFCPCTYIQLHKV